MKQEKIVHYCRKLTLQTFIVYIQKEKQLQQYLMGIEYEQNPRSNDFFNPYIYNKNDELYSFQLKKRQNHQITNQQGKFFIPLNYVDGKFLDELDIISFTTFREILVELQKAVLLLHKKNNLARCISTKNIYVDQMDHFKNKIYLLEFGFFPSCSFDTIYSSSIDIMLIIQIMKELQQKSKYEDQNKFQELMRKIYNLEKELPNLDEFQSYQKFYKLVEDGPSEEQIKQVYVEQWFIDIKKKIEKLDFQKVLQFDIDDSDQTDNEFDPPQLFNHFQFLQMATQMFEQQFPYELNQIGGMFTLQSYLNQNNAELEEQINSSRNRIMDKMRKNYEPQRNLDMISPLNPYKLDLDEFIVYYRAKTQETYKRLLKKENNQYSLEQAKLFFLLMVTLLIRTNYFEEVEISQIYIKSKQIDLVNKANQILRKFYTDREMKS